MPHEEECGTIWSMAMSRRRGIEMPTLSGGTEYVQCVKWMEELAEDGTAIGRKVFVHKFYDMHEITQRLIYLILYYLKLNQKLPS